MSEIFDLIKSVNRLNSKVDELNSRIEFICKYPSMLSFNGMMDDACACKVLRLSSRELRRLRVGGEIPFTRIHRRIHYKASDLQDYIDKMSSPS